MNLSMISRRCRCRWRRAGQWVSGGLAILACIGGPAALASGASAGGSATTRPKPAPPTRSITEAGGTLTAQEKRNARTAIALTDLSENKHEVSLAARRYLDPHYIVHNAYAPEGRDGFVQLVGALVRANPAYTHFIGRVVAQGDYVVLHGLIRLTPQARGTVAIDIFRFNHAAKVVEHWDALQDVVEHTNSGHPQICVTATEPGCS
jgi:predicted SnoaL-like aldol condensation-catalyzing enzyme